MTTQLAPDRIALRPALDLDLVDAGRVTGWMAIQRIEAKEMISRAVDQSRLSFYPVQAAGVALIRSGSSSCSQRQSAS